MVANVNGSTAGYSSVDMGELLEQADKLKQKYANKALTAMKEQDKLIDNEEASTLAGGRAQIAMAGFSKMDSLGDSFVRTHEKTTSE